MVLVLARGSRSAKSTESIGKERKKSVSDRSIATRLPYLCQLSLLDDERVTVDLGLGRRTGQGEQVDLHVRAGLQNRRPYTLIADRGRKL